MPRLSFAKYEGIGNDFLVVDAAETRGWLDAAAATRLCDRHLGVGADGIISLAVDGDRVEMTIHNADGSIPETCGNGLRCAALHLVRTGARDDTPFAIDVPAGPARCHVLESGREGRVEVAMRRASFVPAEIPVVAEAPLVDAVFAIADTPLHVTALSVGNPHVVTFDEVGERRLALGPALERDPRFPEGVNAGFARVLGPNRLGLDVWERGSGWTRACGSGACAAAVAAVHTERASKDAPIEVALPGGVLQIRVSDPGDPLLMTGPARHVFDGAVET